MKAKKVSDEDKELQLDYSADSWWDMRNTEVKKAQSELMMEDFEY